MEVSPDKQNVDALFSTTNYYIDFYQREYKWGRAEVERLLDDVFYKFDLAYEKHKNLDPTKENVTTHYPWYYLNTYITNISDRGRTFIVDGQQRLTTLTLILIRLYHLCAPDRFDLPKRRNWIQTKILGFSGGDEEFWMGHDKRRELMTAIYEGQDPAPKPPEDDITANNMVKNYNIISTYLDKKLDTEHRLNTFVFYFLRMLVLINLQVDQTDVPMVFEVINDRGVRLEPYEILKGKLLGQINKGEVDEFVDIWENCLHELEADDIVDDFFRTHFRAQFASTRDEGREFDGAYHRVIFEPQYNSQLHLDKNPLGVKEFLRKDFKYYSALFSRLNRLGVDYNPEFPHIYFNAGLNQMDSQVMLSMAACSLSDGSENQKVQTISRALDRAYVMLQLNRAYDSNRFQELAFALNKKVRRCPVDEIECMIDQTVLEEINARKSTTYSSLLTHQQFREVGYADYNARFLRYFFARIELFLCEGMGKSLQNPLYDYVRGTGKGNAYHVEHILARNPESESLFTDEAGNTDEDLFERQRNRFGGLLLLKGQDNQSSSNEIYSEKLKTYTGSAPYWSQTLVDGFYKSNMAMKDFIERTGLDFHSISQFDRDALENRSQLLFEIVKQIWQIA